jgi:hypothetical protein
MKPRQSFETLRPQETDPQITLGMNGKLLLNEAAKNLRPVEIGNLIESHGYMRPSRPTLTRAKKQGWVALEYHTPERSPMSKDCYGTAPNPRGYRTRIPITEKNIHNYPLGNPESYAIFQETENAQFDPELIKRYNERTIGSFIAKKPQMIDYIRAKLRNKQGDTTQRNQIIPWETLIERIYDTLPLHVWFQKYDHNQLKQKHTYTDLSGKKYSTYPGRHVIISEQVLIKRALQHIDRQIALLSTLPKVIDIFLRFDKTPLLKEELSYIGPCPISHETIRKWIEEFQREHPQSKKERSHSKMTNEQTESCPEDLLEEIYQTIAEEEQQDQINTQPGYVEYTDAPNALPSYQGETLPQHTQAALDRVQKLFRIRKGLGQA